MKYSENAFDRIMENYDLDGIVLAQKKNQIKKCFV